MAKAAEMFGFIRRIFRKPEIVYPFRGAIRAMKAKDPEYFASEVGWRRPMDGINKWRSKYPEDFPGVNGATPAGVINDSSMVKQ